jgi:hypothetical protein
METRITLEFDGKDTSARSIVNMLKSVGLFRVVEENTLPRATRQAVSDTIIGRGKKHKTISSLMDDLLSD